MAEATKKKKCRLLQQMVGNPGRKIKVYGHDFVMQDDLTSIGYIDEERARIGEKAGRWVILADEDEPQKGSIASSSPLADMTFDIDTYYGAGDLDKLRLQILKARGGDIREFAKERQLDSEFKDNMTKIQMADAIQTSIDNKK